ncbi:MFS transporter [Niallia sp. FSL R7-0648]|uniref:MFS transporter n=1 Tax=Niallia sp. FSL R7-0648 TaxID=2954521 RepID=UPI0030FC614C
MKNRPHYAWIIVFATFIALLAVQGVRLSFGAFIIPWEKQFSLDRSQISLISTLSFITYGISQPIIGKLVDIFGARKIILFSTVLVSISITLTKFVNEPWQLFLLYGIFVSLGVGGSSNVAAAVIVTKWFQSKRGLALGIVEAGFGAGQMILVPLSLILIQDLGWKGTVLALGAFLLLIIIPLIMWLLKDSPADKGLEPYNDGKEIFKEHQSDTATVPVNSIFFQRNFWLLILPFTICGFTTTGLMDTHLIPFSHDHGFSTSVTSTAVSTLAAFNIIGILLSGYLADRWSSRKMLIIFYFIRSISFIILLMSHNATLLIIFAIIFGLVDFATVAPTQLLATKLFKNYSVGYIIGWLFLSHQIGSALGSYIPGLMYSHHGEYSLAFYLSIVILIVSTILTYILPEQEGNKTLNKKQQAS